MPDNEAREAALAWAVRTGDPQFTDWPAFTIWLEADPAHASAYSEVAAAVADAVEEAHQAAQAANGTETAPAAQVRRRWFLSALAAASLALVVGVRISQEASGRYVVETAPGEMRTLALRDGGSVMLSGGTRLRLDRDNPRLARLEKGQALFNIQHDAKRPFAVLVGEDRLVDAGTVFDVAFSGQRMQVAVSEGLVIYNPGQQGVKVAPGHMLAKQAGGRGYTLTPVDLEQVGEWRIGRATFEDAPLPEVAARLSRMTGLTFKAEAGGGSFSGSILIAPLRDDPQSLGALLGTTVRREGTDWVIAAS